MLPYNRNDLTDWIIHFVHDRKPEDQPSTMLDNEGNEHDLRIPDYYDDNGNPHNLWSEYDENDYEIFEDAPAFDVLKRILHDGFIKSGWSLRDFCPSIYGPTSAVCFTEMPLYALIEYTKFREKTGYVGGYGIAFHRNELFSAGARPVIYGLSTPYKETENLPYRALAEGTGIGLQEQYRYVSTNLPSKKVRGQRIDWTHEREWRWALPRTLDQSVPGLPFLIKEDGRKSFFTQIIVIVKKDEEIKNIIEHLKNIYDSKKHNILDCPYNQDLIANARVLSLESLAIFKPDNLNDVRLDDLPLHQLPVMPTFEVSSDLEHKVRDAVAEAQKITSETIDEIENAHPEQLKEAYNCGWAYICTNKVSEITQALLNAGLVETYADDIYFIRINDDCYNAPICADGAKEGAKYLTKKLGQYFYSQIHYD